MPKLKYVQCGDYLIPEMGLNEDDKIPPRQVRQNAVSVLAATQAGTVYKAAPKWTTDVLTTRSRSGSPADDGDDAAKDGARSWIDGRNEKHRPDATGRYNEHAESSG